MNLTSEKKKIKDKKNLPRNDYTTCFVFIYWVKYKNSVSLIKVDSSMELGDRLTVKLIRTQRFKVHSKEQSSYTEPTTSDVATKWQFWDLWYKGSNSVIFNKLLPLYYLFVMLMFFCNFSITVYFFLCLLYYSCCYIIIHL